MLHASCLGRGCLQAYRAFCPPHRWLLSVGDPTRTDTVGPSPAKRKHRTPASCYEKPTLCEIDCCFLTLTSPHSTRDPPPLMLITLRRKLAVVFPPPTPLVSSTGAMPCSVGRGAMLCSIGVMPCSTGAMPSSRGANNDLQVHLWRPAANSCTPSMKYEACARMCVSVCVGGKGMALETHCSIPQPRHLQNETKDLCEGIFSSSAIPRHGSSDEFLEAGGNSHGRLV